MHTADLVTQIRSYIAGEVSIDRPNQVTLLKLALKEIQQCQRDIAAIQRLRGELVCEKCGDELVKSR